jgi:hypothetical protein
MLPAPAGKRPHVVDGLRRPTAVNARPGSPDSGIHLGRDGADYLCGQLPGTPGVSSHRRSGNPGFRWPGPPPAWPASPAVSLKHVAALSAGAFRGPADIAAALVALECPAALCAGPLGSPTSSAAPLSALEGLAAPCADSAGHPARIAAAPVALEGVAALHTGAVNSGLAGPAATLVTLERPAAFDADSFGLAAGGATPLVALEKVAALDAGPLGPATSGASPAVRLERLAALNAVAFGYPACLAAKRSALKGLAAFDARPLRLRLAHSSRPVVSGEGQARSVPENAGRAAIEHRSGCRRHPLVVRMRGCEI